MGNLKGRLESLEEAFAEAREESAGELGRRLFREAYARLSVVEAMVLSELWSAYRLHPDLSSAELWHDLTEALRKMQYVWLDAVRGAARDLADTE